MPVARGPQINARSAVVVGLTGIIIALLLGGMVLWVASSSDTVAISLGDAQFDAGFTGRQAEEIAARGPILYADAGSAGQRDLFIQHIGADPEVGWLAFSARRVGDPRDCSIVWDDGSRTFALVSSTDAVCDAISFDELGCGLLRYPVEVIDDKVIVFLNENQDEVDAALAVDSNEVDASAEDPDLSCLAS